MNANFAHFENFHKSSSADFGAFNASQSSTTAAAASKAAVSKPGLPSADKYAALANLDNIFSAGQGMALCSLVCSRCMCVCAHHRDGCAGVMRCHHSSERPFAKLPAELDVSTAIARKECPQTAFWEPTSYQDE